MKKYVKPDMFLAILDCQDVCTASPVGNENGLTLTDYDYESKWL